MRMINNMTSNEWISLLERAQSEKRYVGRDSQGKYFLCDKISKISLKAVEQQSRTFEREFSVEALRLAIHLKSLAKHSNQKHYKGLKKIIKIFVIAFNGFTGCGFATTESRIDQLAKKMERINQDPDKLFEKTNVNQSNQSAQSSIESITYQSITKYTKEEHNTAKLVPTVKNRNKAFIGQGASGRVVLHRDDSKLVVKKSFKDLTEEFRLGKQLSHPCIVQSRQLFIKTYANSKNRICKLVMDKVDGTVINYLKSKISDEVTSVMLLEVKHTMSYLFLNNVFWADTSCNNIFVTFDNHFKICDLGFWREEKNRVILAKRLLLGAMQIVYSILRSADLGSDDSKEVLIDRIYKPQQFFVVPCNSKIIDSLHIDGFEKLSWMQSVLRRLKNSSQEKCIEILNSYIDAVLENFLNRQKQNQDLKVN